MGKRIEIVKAGPLSSIQDEGRYGYMRSGIPPSGVMDKKAYEESNELVGNKDGEAVIEATLLGPEIFFEENTIFAITGAEMNAKLDGEPLKRGKAYQAMAGQTLSMGLAISGVRSYIAFRGGIDVPVVMGSRSTNLKSSFGGYEGRKLKDGDIIKIAEGRNLSEKELAEVLEDEKVQPDYSNKISVRVILGPQDDYFSEDIKKRFFEESYKVSDESDRMGIRLSGEKLEGLNGTDIVSDGITFGSIQVTSSGQPIVLMADHQTTGGYAKIATVVSEDLPLLSQARPGDSVEFVKTDIDKLQRSGIYKWIFQRKSLQR